MSLKTFLTLSLALFLLISCNEEQTNKETTITKEETDIITTKEEIPSPPTTADKVKRADDKMAKIEAAKAEQSITQKRYMNPKEAHDQSIYVVYSQNDKMVKLTENMGESMYLADVAYYYHNDNIFLIHTLNSFDDNLYNETKVYLENGQVIAAMGRSKEETDFDTDFTSLQIEKLDFNKVIYDMDSYLENLSKIPTRLAASTPE